jgi:tetratricopeptide (TPR) repeat protein
MAYYERVISTPGLYRLFDDAHTLAPTYKRLGELYEERGNHPKALDYYSRFVDLWKDADPELQPVVRDVHGRLARLAGEH